MGIMETIRNSLKWLEKLKSVSDNTINNTRHASPWKRTPAGYLFLGLGN